MIEWLIEQYRTNEFLMGTTVPFAIAAAAYASRYLAKSAFRLAKTSFTCNLTSNSDGYRYHSIVQFARNHIVSERFRREAEITYNWDAPSGKHYGLNTGFGTSYGFYKGCPAVVRRSIMQSDSAAFKQQITITILTLTPSATMDAIRAELQLERDMESEKTTVSVYRREGCDNVLITDKPRRSFSTMRVKQSCIDSIKSHLDTFMASKLECEASGKPWHTGIMFHGSPGTGKTSMTHCIASYLKKDIQFFGGGSVWKGGFDPNRFIMAMEDVDASDIAAKLSDRDGDNLTCDSMSDILNFLDSFATPHGMVTIATTNHIDKLDPAFFRKGRFDLVINMDDVVLPP